MVKSVNVKNSTLVVPAEETPSKNVWLSRLDMIARSPYAHNYVMYIYHPDNNTRNDSKTSYFDANKMKESLSKALVPFYPIAGRLRMNESNGRYEIECNSKGALFVEAETTVHTLADLGDEFKPNDELRKCMIPECDYSKGLGSFPLLMVQLTRFKCGGVCLGFAQHHHFTDFTSQMHFTLSWARIARGLDILVMPIHDRATYLGLRDPPLIKFNHLEYHPSLPPLPPKDLSGKIYDAVEGKFKLTKDQIEAMKQEAMSQNTLDYKLTTFEVLAAHVWRSVCKARGLANDQEVEIHIPVNGRSKLKLPAGYCGNVLFFPSFKARARDVMQKPLWFVASKIHDTIVQMNDPEYLRSSVDYLESEPDLRPFVRGPHTLTCPNLSANSWGRLPFEELDFGWGKPTSTLHGGIKWEGQSVLIPSQDGDGSFTLAIKLFSPHFALFGKYFYSLQSKL